MPSNATKDTVAGAVGGVAQVLIGKPKLLHKATCF